MRRCELRIGVIDLLEVKKIAMEKEISQAEVIRNFVTVGLAQRKKEALENLEEVPSLDLESPVIESNPKTDIKEPIESESVTKETIDSESDGTQESDPENPPKETTVEESKSPDIECDPTESCSLSVEEKDPPPESELKGDNPGKLLLLAQKKLKKEAKKEISKSVIEG